MRKWTPKQKNIAFDFGRTQCFFIQIYILKKYILNKYVVGR